MYQFLSNFFPSNFKQKGEKMYIECDCEDFLSFFILSI